MSKIISVSRRTDIPAFYGEWFVNRLEEGFAGYINPFGGQKYIVSLKPEDVICFVFWSKNFEPFIEKLKIIEKMGYRFCFNYTITGLPSIFECNLTDKKYAINSLKKISRLYSPKHINWRYDPVVISSITDYNFHLKNFEDMAFELQGYVERCYFSYVTQYGKVKRNFDKFQNEHNAVITDPDIGFKTELAEQMSEIAKQHGISLFTCCGDYLINANIKKAHCIDGKIIEDLFFKDGLPYKKKPTRKECGCTESTDIGTYDTCPHGCIYCYANINKIKADAVYRNHDIKSAFLGYSKDLSDKWIKESSIKDFSEYMNTGKKSEISASIDSLSEDINKIYGDSIEYNDLLYGYIERYLFPELLDKQKIIKAIRNNPYKLNELEDVLALDNL
ncbi:MAG: DUF1848 domain-containing protein [Desulfobacteraceae bacterium]|nr:DUF1848 domain-containing protein [Desulfobacteraceae bacterium]